MTIGIYLLQFEGTDGVYIGQSLNIEKRYYNHTKDMLQGLCAKKLQQAYLMYGKPSLHILTKCHLAELNSLEYQYINEFNAITSGFNTVKGGDGARVGECNPQALYSRDKYIQVLEYLVETTLTSEEISNITKVGVFTVKHISALDRHEWLEEICPEYYSELKRLRSLGTKRCAAAQGIIYPKIVSPEGTIYEVHNITKFAKEQGLQSGGLCSLLNGKTYTHKGWYVEGFEHPVYPTIQAPDGTIYKIPYRGIKPFARQHNLHPSSLALLLKGVAKTHKGWKLNDS